MKIITTTSVHRTWVFYRFLRLCRRNRARILHGLVLTV